MRHARPVLCESLSATARIATGGLYRRETHVNAAPGRIYHEIARRCRNENHHDNARDRSPARVAVQPSRPTPGSPYSNSLARSALQSNVRAPARGAASHKT